ncbi:MAG: MBL fold metallo-hydrolase [bacterium]|nr:MBL fold metallo-hydrolase [bacterium]
MIEAALKDDAFLADVEAARADRDAFHLWRLGQSGFLIQWRGRHCLLDPYLSDSLTKKYHGTEKPHVRMTERVIAPERLDFIDVVTSTHNHTDHLDAETLLPLKAANPDLKLVMPAANVEFAKERLLCEADWFIPLNDGERETVGEFSFHAVPAAHESLDADDEGRCRYLGYVVRFGHWSVYHSGDTVRYEGMIERLRPFSVDLALLPINGRDPSRGVPGNLDGPEAARLAYAIGASLAIPCHYEMFEFNCASPGAFVNEAQLTGQPYRLLRPGQRWSSSELG